MVHTNDLISIIKKAHMERKFSASELSYVHKLIQESGMIFGSSDKVVAEAILDRDDPDSMSTYKVIVLEGANLQAFAVLAIKGGGWDYEDLLIDIVHTKEAAITLINRMGDADWI